MIAGQGTPDQAPARLFAYRRSGPVSRLVLHCWSKFHRTISFVNCAQGRRRCKSSIAGRASCQRRSLSVGTPRTAQSYRRQGSRGGAGRADHRLSSRRGDFAGRFRGARRRGGDRPRYGGRSSLGRRSLAARTGVAGQSRSPRPCCRRRRPRRGRRSHIGGAFRVGRTYSILVTASCRKRPSAMSSNSSIASAAGAEARTMIRVACLS